MKGSSDMRQPNDPEGAKAQRSLDMSFEHPS